MLLLNDPSMLGILIAHLDTSNTKIFQLMMILATFNGIICLVSFLATREVVALLANDVITLLKSKLLLKHLESQNSSIISDSID